VPPGLLNKSGKPNPGEWDVLRRHPEEGARLAAPLLPWLGEWGEVIAAHHERYDGLGYPGGLAGTEVCRGARIVAVADSFEVMTAPRAYKRAMTRAAALQELARCAGTQFDPAAVRALMQVSTPRLRWAMGPLSWLAQVPVVYPASNGGVAGQAAAGLGVLAIGGAVGLGASGAQASDIAVNGSALPAAAPAAAGAAETMSDRAATTAGSSDVARTLQPAAADAPLATSIVLATAGRGDTAPGADREDSADVSSSSPPQQGRGRQVVSRLVEPVAPGGAQVVAALPKLAPGAPASTTAVAADLPAGIPLAPGIKLPRQRG